MTAPAVHTAREQSNLHGTVGAAAGALVDPRVTRASRRCVYQAVNSLFVRINTQKKGAPPREIESEVMAAWRELSIQRAREKLDADDG